MGAHVHEHVGADVFLYLRYQDEQLGTRSVEAGHLCFPVSSVVMFSRDFEI